MNYFMSLDPLALFRSMPGAFAQGMVWGLMALGVYITYRLLDFADLTVDGSLATGGAVAVMLIRGGMSPWAALIFAFLAGMAAGFITGILHTALGIPGILASILTQISLYSINLNIMGCSNQAVSVDKYPLVVSLRYLSDSNSTRVQIFATCILFCFAIVAILYWYFGTEQGHAIRATGCNQQMARAQGINTNLHTVIALMISNGLVGLSGGLYAQYQGAADVNMGRGAIVIGLAAVIIGEVLFGRLCAGKNLAFAYTLFSVIGGAIIYYIVMNVVLWLKLPSDDLKLFSGNGGSRIIMTLPGDIAELQNISENRDLSSRIIQLHQNIHTGLYGGRTCIIGIVDHFDSPAQMIDLLAHWNTFIRPQSLSGYRRFYPKMSGHSNRHQRVQDIMKPELLDHNFFSAFRINQRKAVFSIFNPDILRPVITALIRTEKSYRTVKFSSSLPEQRIVPIQKYSLLFCKIHGNF